MSLVVIQKEVIICQRKMVQAHRRGLVAHGRVVVAVRAARQGKDLDASLAAKRENANKEIERVKPLSFPLGHLNKKENT